MVSQKDFSGRLTDKRALVTGASRGIGRVVAEAFVAAGAAVALCARRPEPLNAVVAELQKAGGISSRSRPTAASPTRQSELSRRRTAHSGASTPS